MRGRKGAAPNLRYIEVLWCKTPVYIERLSVQDLKGELGFQIYCAEWLNAKASEPGRPAINNYSHWHHSAGENRGSGIYGVRAGLMAKRSGQIRGWPDWQNCHLRRIVELKLPNGALSDAQRDILAYFVAIKWQAEVVRSFERFKEIVESS